MAQNFDIDFLVSLYIDPKESSTVHRSQLAHRVHIVKDIWAIPAGSKVLEIGPGQGDCTLVLAAAVGDNGHVDAVDPCDLDYGSPWTVGQAQSHISHGPFGPRITFIQAAPLAHLATTAPGTYTHVVLFNCIWYFDSPDTISALLAVLAQKTHVSKILITEWALEAQIPAQMPHVLAALARANLEWVNGKSTANIRTPVSPEWLKAWFEEQGVDVQKEKMVMPPEELLDGRWEVGSVIGESFLGRVEMWCKDHQKVGVLGIRHALIAAIRGLKGGLDGVQSMQVWVAEF